MWVTANRNKTDTETKLDDVWPYIGKYQIGGSLYNPSLIKGTGGIVAVQSKVQETLIQINLQDNKNTCWNCSEDNGADILCKGCLTAVYCSRECMLGNFCGHREECKCMKKSQYGNKLMTPPNSDDEDIIDERKKSSISQAFKSSP